MKITNENEFLGALIKCANQNNDCEITAVIKKYGISELDCSPFIDSLKSKKLIEMYGFSTIHIFPSGKSAYISRKKKVLRYFFNSSKTLLKFTITYILGIASGLIIAYIAHKFGWN